jgi:ankyrin repeat protein
MNYFYIFLKKKVGIKDEKYRDSFIKLLQHKNVYNQNFMHTFAQLTSAQSDLFKSTFLNNFANQIKSVATSLPILHFILLDKDILGRTPLHLCLLLRGASSDNIDLEFFLIDNSNKSVLFERDSYNRLPLHYLFYNSSDDKTRQFFLTAYTNPCLLENKNKIENDIKFDANSGALDPVELLNSIIKKMNNKQFLDEPDVYGYTPMHYASIRGSTISCFILINNDCNFVHASLIDQNTPLSSSIHFKRETCALGLLRCITDTSTLDKYSLKDLHSFNPQNYVNSISVLFLIEIV